MTGFKSKRQMAQERTSMKDEALKLALEALEVASSCVDGYYVPKGKTHLSEVEKAITAIREALAQPVQKPVDLEIMASAVHDAYLNTCDALGWGVKPENRVPYSELTEDSKELDRASVRAVLRLAQPPLPVQEPVAYYHSQKGFYFAKPTRVLAPTIVDVEPLALYTTPPMPEERNFCARCGKRTADLATIHTCTPPQEKNNG